MCGRRGGFGLIETLVATVLVGLVAGAALTTLSSGYSAAARARTQVILMELAEQKIAEARALSPAVVRSLARATTPVQQQFPQPSAAYSWSLVVVPDPNDADFFNVHVTVRTDGASRTLDALLYRAVPAPGVN